MQKHYSCIHAGHTAYPALPVPQLWGWNSNIIFWHQKNKDLALKTKPEPKNEKLGLKHLYWKMYWP